MSDFFINMRTSSLNLNEIGGAFVRLLMASKELLSRRYRDGECDALAICRFSDEVGEVEQWIADDYRNTDNHAFTFVIEKMLAEIRANVSLGEKFEIQHIMTGWFKNGDRLLIRVTGCSFEADERYHRKHVTISRDHYDLLKEAAEEWAKDWRRPTQLLRTVRCKSCLSATRIDELNTYHSAMVVHTHNCKAARILGLKMEGS